MHKLLFSASKPTPDLLYKSDCLPYSVPENSCWLSCLQYCCVLNDACNTLTLKMIEQFASKRWINFNISRISPEVFLCTE